MAPHVELIHLEMIVDVVVAVLFAVGVAMAVSSEIDVLEEEHSDAIEEGMQR